MIQIRRKRLIWSGAALFIVGLACLIFPAYGSYCESNQANDYYCAAYGMTLALGTWAEAHNGAITALATVAVAGFTLTLWRTSKQQGIIAQESIDLARKEYVSTHRPRIVLKDAYLIAETVNYRLVNLGGTPATIIESWIFAEFVEKNTRLRPLLPTGHDDLGQLRFIGGESKELEYALPNEISFAIKFPDSRRIGLEGRPAVFGERYFVGVIVYADDLGIKRRSIFRRRWDDDSLTFVRLTPEQERDHEYAD